MNFMDTLIKFSTGDVFSYDVFSNGKMDNYRSYPIILKFR